MSLYDIKTFKLKTFGLIIKLVIKMEPPFNSFEFVQFVNQYLIVSKIYLLYLFDNAGDDAP